MAHIHTFSFINMRQTNAKVLPDPVGAQAKNSHPFR